MESGRLDDLATGAGLPSLGPIPVVEGHDPTFAYPLAIGEAAATGHALAADAATTLWAQRAGPEATGRLSVRRVAASLASFALLGLDGRPHHDDQWTSGRSRSLAWRPTGVRGVPARRRSRVTPRPPPHPDPDVRPPRRLHGSPP